MTGGNKRKKERRGMIEIEKKEKRRGKEENEVNDGDREDKK